MKYDETSLTKVLQWVFGHDNFLNAVQKDATVAIVEGGQSVCISMPPGLGRSLCFQLPAIVQGKVAIIHSPKLSFMKKEVEFLRSKQINACLLHQTLYPSKRRSILENLISGSPTIPLLYVTPDIALLAYFQKLIFELKRRKKLSYIVFNEAHYLSKLGYEYTSNYTRISAVRKIYDGIPKIVVTTTVTNEVIKDICEVLALKNPKIFILAAQKINVVYDIWFLDVLPDPFEHLKNFIVEVLGFLGTSIQKVLQKGCAIIYCREVATAELLKNKLNASGISTLAYHHKLTRGKQRNIENKWISGDAYVITTTYSYGFIYKKSIRCTVYWTVPENISKYYRESMQNRSDNNLSHCRIYFSVKEYLSVKMAIENHDVINDSEHIKQRLKEYEKLISYCLLVKCRHVVISQYFGRVIPPCKRNCDVCKDEEIVEVRTAKFLVFSEGREGIKYNSCEISEDLPIKETNCEELKVKDNNKQIVQYNDKTSQEGTVHTCTYTSQSLVDKNNVRKDATSPELGSSSRKIIKQPVKRKNSIKSPNRKRIKVLKITKMKVGGRSDLIPRRDSPEVVVADTKYQQKLNSDNKPSIEIQKVTDKKAVMKQSMKPLKNNSNASESRDKAIIEYLMDKYNLDRQSITLEIKKK
nr:ATP-dependent DNA helicase Q5-like [Osmia lignaria]